MKHLAKPLTWFRAATGIAVALLATLAGTAMKPAHAAPSHAWSIGPVIDGRNYSRMVAEQPSPGRNGSWHVELPQAPGSINYVTFRHGSLAGKKRIVMRYRIEAEPGARIVPTSAPHMPSMLTLYFQRSGDNWRGTGPYEAYRWYATFASRSPIAPGEYRIVAPFDANWTAVQHSSARNNPAAFREALARADRVGFVLGGGDGFGHGVFATGRARLIVTEFRVE